MYISKIGLFMGNAGEITRLLQSNNTSALEGLLPIVYEELHSLAAALFRREYRSNHTLQPTAIVHEAYLRLVGSSNNISWQNRAHFFGIAANVMRQILVNHAHARNAQKRGGSKTIIALNEAASFFETNNLDILALHAALDKLSKLDSRQSKLVELKFFGGLKNEEIAEVLQISVSTVKREWEMARAWLYHQLKNTF
jgi:RNA polymerase sigma factor (TIGR02999 family)